MPDVISLSLPWPSYKGFHRWQLMLSPQQIAFVHWWDYPPNMAGTMYYVDRRLRVARLPFTTNAHGVITGIPQRDTE